MLPNGYVRWLVLYFRTEKGALRRRTYYRSSEILQPPTTSEGPMHQAAIISTYDINSYKRVGSAAQSLRTVFVRTCVVGAALSRARHTLVVAMRVPGAPEDENSGPYFRFQPICLASWAATAPSFDVVDWSLGKAAPVFCLGHAFPNSHACKCVICLQLRCQLKSIVALLNIKALCSIVWVIRRKPQLFRGFFHQKVTQAAQYSTSAVLPVSF